MSSISSIRYLAKKTKPTMVSPFLFAVSLLLILIVSLYPFSGWRFTGEPITAFYTYPLPYYFTVFDNAINILAYIPLGLSAVLILRRYRLAFLYATCICLLVSMSIEFVQQFLPSRVASNMDMISNVLGGGIGAIAGVVLSHRYFLQYWLHFRHDYLASSAVVEWGFIWLALWFVTQFDPSLPFLGVVVMPQGLPQPFVSPIQSPALFLRLLEGGGMMLHLLAVALFVSLLVRYHRYAPRAIASVLICALLVKMGFAGMLLQPEQFFAWINLNIALGGIAGIVLLAFFLRLNRRLRAWAGFLALCLINIITYLWPLSPNGSSNLDGYKWSYGHLQHFNGMSSAIGDIWPIGTMLFLFYFMLFLPEDND
ncbi:VanZ family protein [Deefgea piscis]|uniref:VanZ family protein n=1 Tax=Deefgea piscis TaxID=2739061 RepID=UPI001C801DFE|nr:VanZ family protein [Deefgea piscis]QZA81808.1 VanZ family protein [Deefgea piscis]